MTRLRCRVLFLIAIATLSAVACASEGDGAELAHGTSTTTTPTTTAPETTVGRDTTTTTRPETTTTTTTTTTTQTTTTTEADTATPQTSTTTAPETTVTPQTTTTTTAQTTTTTAPQTTAPPQTTVPQPIVTIPAHQIPQGDLPAGLVTPLGIPVAVLGLTDSGYLVRTPCGNTAEVSKGVLINDVRVVIDPGHGGPVDTGAVGPNGLVERDLNLTLARAVLDELARRGISAVSTRTGGYGTLLSVRALLADDLGAEALVSIHHNAPTWATSSTPGSEVFIQSASRDLARADSARLGGLLYEEVTAALAAFEGIPWSRSSSAGVLRVLSSSGRDAYGMIVRPAVPTALIEYGYISNLPEAELFTTDEYIQVAATATADAIDAYLHTERPGTGFIQRPRIYNPQRAPSFCQDPALE